MATTPAEFLDQVNTAAGDIAEALVGHGHRAALAALIRTYVQIAEQSPCCRRAAASDALQAGAHLISPIAGPTGAIH